MNLLCVYESPYSGHRVALRDYGVSIDLDTGVNYLAECADGGNNYTKVICPRYNSDGSLFVTPKTELDRLRAQAIDERLAKKYI